MKEITVQINPYLEFINSILLTSKYNEITKPYIGYGLMNGNFGIHFFYKELNKADIFSVFTTDEFSLSPAVLFHEYSHLFINPLTEKYTDIVKRYINTYELLKLYKLPDYQSGYGDWQEYVNEHLVRAMSIYLLKKCHLLVLIFLLFPNLLSNGLILFSLAFSDFSSFVISLFILI